MNHLPFPPRRAPGLAAAALAGLVGSLASGCDQDGEKVPPPPPVSGRSEAVLSTARPAMTAAAKPASTGKAGRPPGQLCSSTAARPVPKASPKTVAAPGAAEPPSAIPFGVGKWVWLNFWAAWCGPCKEEMPRLLAWQKKLSTEGKKVELAFVSIDDDERQMRRFLEGQPAGGVKATYWLPEGASRSSFLTGLGVAEAPNLPVHVLVGPDGQVACTIQGAVEDADYPAVAALLGK